MIAQELADEAFQIALRHIQAKLEIATGDFAAQFWTGVQEQTVVRALTQYAQAEMDQQGEDVEYDVCVECGDRDPIHSMTNAGTDEQPARVCSHCKEFPAP